MARAAGVVPVIRAFERSSGHVNRALDLGAMGMLFADVRSRDEIDELARWMRYPPRGSRGHTSLGAASDYVAGPQGEIKGLIDENTITAIQVESAEAVEGIDGLLAGGGVDIVQIGVGDLSTSLGVPFQIRHPSVLAAADRVIEACRRHRVAVGMTCSSAEDAEDLVRRGVRCVSWSNDRHLLMRAYSEGVTQLKKAAAQMGRTAAEFEARRPLDTTAAE
jgi:4-hydroxy-2-oxoheptanedioate aldolase